MKNKKFKFLEHTADIKFQAYGKNLEEVFENSSLALFNILYDKRVKEKKSYKIKAEGKDFESLLYNFLEEFLILFDSKNFLPGRIKKMKLNEENFRIEAEVIGDYSGDYQINEHIKAITYNDMFVKKENSNWVSQVVVDV